MIFPIWTRAWGLRKPYNTYHFLERAPWRTSCSGCRCAGDTARWRYHLARPTAYTYEGSFFRGRLWHPSQKVSGQDVFIRASLQPDPCYHCNLAWWSSATFGACRCRAGQCEGPALKKEILMLKSNFFSHITGFRLTGWLILQFNCMFNERALLPHMLAVRRFFCNRSSP